MVAFNTEYKTPEDLLRLTKEAQHKRDQVVSPKQVEVLEREQVQAQSASAAHTNPRFSKNHRRFSTGFLIVGALIAVAIIAVVIVFASGALNSSKPVVAITVAQQEDGELLLDDLYVNKVISDKDTFRKLLSEHKLYSAVAPGLYNLPEQADLSELIALLQRGPDFYLLTLPEGLTLQQTVSRIHAAVPKISATEITALANDPAQFSGQFDFLTGLTSLEGYLYPATYRFVNDITASDIVEILLQKFADSTASLRSSALSDSLRAAGLDFSDAVIIASLIERETANSKEKANVASVIYNRLELGMKLQIDATVAYALQQSPTGYDGHPLLYADLEIDSPYNTYLFTGLPAGPIANPSLESIQAALTPTNTDYIYYVLSDANDGTHVFCSTDAEFEAARARYNAAFGLS